MDSNGIVKMRGKSLWSCERFSSQHMQELIGNMTKRSDILIVVEELKENYTKVSYRQTLTSLIDSNELLKSKKTSKIPKRLIKLAIAGAIFYFTMDLSVFAASSLDEKAEKLYFDKFIGIAKWIVVGKGAWDIISRAMKEDFDGAKRSILQYLLIFAVLMGLPWALTEVENIFREEI